MANEEEDFVVTKELWDNLLHRLDKAKNARESLQMAVEHARATSRQKKNEDLPPVILGGVERYIPLLGFLGIACLGIGMIQKRARPIATSNPPWFFLGDGLAGLYLWLMFGFLSNMLSCDLQRMLRQPNFWWFQYFIAFLSFFFLINLVMNQTEGQTFEDQVGQASALFIVFVISTKARARFAIITILILAVDQFLRAYNTTHPHPNITLVRTYLIAFLYAVIFYGLVDYVMRRIANSQSFSFSKLFTTPRQHCPEEDLRVNFWRL